MDLETLVTKLDNPRMMVIPVAVLLISLAILGVTFATTGSPVKQGIEFTGGTLVTLPISYSHDEIASALAGYPVVEIRPQGSRHSVQLGPMDEDTYSALAKLVNSRFERPEIRYMGPIYSKQLQADAPRFLLLSFLLMAIVVLVIFRQPVVSAIVVFCAMADIMAAAAFMTLVGVKLSLGTMAALLMLVGYSVDTDILLSVKVLKRAGDLPEKIKGAMETGIMMTGTTISAVLALMLVSSLLFHLSPSFTRIDIIADITTVLFFGLLADMMNTWITNVQGLKWYLARNPKAAVSRRGRK
ncbi:MAG: Protein-export membrane protein SecF [Methanosaeta sp. PtaB.Bin039]|nr:MAG: Protein-export membrane protein SecF [Methanosaeta sp. PtaB.Bin039]HOT06893.1 protein translocase subunit SecF [Methanotrichaceae archaeon]HQF16485.1 protein translocase subunit SecF [Methanotrichaceae archaeon]HQI91908.1 protein translocase subunit SecF [Methanotrichaceae archaeon]HQJ28465.1 protein translocase subunit SecF [Methanotrichaceae archaeon]